MAKIISQDDIFIALIVSLLFLTINYDNQFGLIFSLMAFGGIALWTLDRGSHQTVFEKTTSNRIEAFLVSSIFYSGFILGTGFLFSLLTPQALNTSGYLASVLSVQASAIPYLANDAITNFISTGIIVPFVESIFFFALLLEVFADRRGISIRRSNMFSAPGLALSIFIAFIFTVFHLTAKIAGGSEGFIITFVFGLLSAMLVFYYNGETKQAILLHVLANSIAMGVACGFIKIAGAATGTC